MKVLSLTEPYATLIKEKKKRIETRRWKTNYRGELYIHASATNIPKEWKENKELMNLVDNKELNFGYIICKCTLVDCIYMTKEYVENIKRKNYQEYICGDYKEGRYAWLLEGIEPLKSPIKARGSLNIWNYYNDTEIMNLMSNIEYGYVDKSNKKHTIFDESYPSSYKLQAPKEIINSKVGTCWDQVELERYYFKGNDWNVKTYFIIYYDNNKCPTHTFLTYEKEKKYFWFENSWEPFRGIHEYKSKKDLLLDVKSKFIKDQLNENYKEKNLYLYEYKKPKWSISMSEFYKHCESGKVIDFSNL